MNEQELNSIEATRYEVTFKPNEIIYKQGTNTNQIVTITEGLAKGYIEGSGDKNFIFGLFKPYTLISGPGVYVDFKNHFSLKAIEKNHLLFL